MAVVEHSDIGKDREKGSSCILRSITHLLIKRGVCIKGKGLADTRNRRKEGNADASKCKLIAVNRPYTTHAITRNEKTTHGLSVMTLIWSRAPRRRKYIHQYMT